MLAELNELADIHCAPVPLANAEFLTPGHYHITSSSRVKRLQDLGLEVLLDWTYAWAHAASARAPVLMPVSSNSAIRSSLRAGFGVALNYDFTPAFPKTIDRITASLDSTGHHHEAARIRDLHQWSLEDDEDAPMRLASLDIAARFIVDRTETAASDGRVLAPTIGVGYPAIWMTADGNIDLCWETDERSVIVKCRSESNVQLHVTEHGVQTSESLPAPEAIVQSRRLLDSI
ncbi:MAG: hypothetical protein OXG65_02350 [Chloroflexi bacterium]|nr:hypothetical protein [Chloroflexota bacterium]